MTSTTQLSTGVRTRTSEAVDFGVVGLALLGVVGSFPLSRGSAVYAAEPLLLLASFMTLRYRAPAFRQRDTSVILLLGVTLLAVQIATDVFRSSAPEDFLRGWARTGFFLAALCAFTVLLTTRQRVLVTVFAFSCGQMISALALTTAQEQTDIWKFGIGGPATICALALLGLLEARRRWFVLSLAALSVFDVYMGSRSLGLFSAAAAATLLATAPHDRYRLPRRGALVRLGIAGVIALVCVGYAYTWAAASGRLGAAAETKYENQSGGSAGILLGARPELLATLYAIRASPVIGYGSWPLDRKGFNARAKLALTRRGYVLLPGPVSDRIPIHSHLFGAWVEAGLLGAAFWLAVLVVAVRALITVLRRPFSSLTPLVAFGTYALAWDIFFSPFGAERRVTTALLIATLLFAQNETRES